VKGRKGEGVRRLNSAAKIIFIAFLWLACMLAVVALTNQTKFDWLASVFFYTSFVLIIILGASEVSQYTREIKEEEAKPTFRRLAIIFSAIAIWLGSYLGLLVLLPNKEFITFPVWIVWSMILILLVWRLEKNWKSSHS
jgi:predicted MFS family arabinose efflux permease